MGNDLSALPADNVLPQFIPPYLVPLDLLACDGELPSKAFEGILSQTAKRTGKLLLVVSLSRSNAREDGVHRERRDG